MSAASFPGLFYDPLAPAGRAGFPGSPAAAAGTPATARSAGTAGATSPSCVSAPLTAASTGNPEIEQRLSSRRLQEGRAAALLQVQEDLERLLRGRAAS